MHVMQGQLRRADGAAQLVVTNILSLYAHQDEAGLHAAPHACATCVAHRGCTRNEQQFAKGQYPSFRDLYIYM
jgi:hypothetical protein